MSQVSKIETSQEKTPLVEVEAKKKSLDRDYQRLQEKVDFYLKVVGEKNEDLIKLRENILKAKTSEEKEKIIQEAEKIIGSSEKNDGFEAKIEKAEEDPILIEKTEASWEILNFLKNNPNAKLKDLQPKDLQGKIEVNFQKKLEANPALWAAVKSLAGDGLDVYEVVSSKDFWQSSEGKTETLISAGKRDLGKALKSAKEFQEKNPRAAALAVGGVAILSILMLFKSKEKKSDSAEKGNGGFWKFAGGALGLGAAVLGFKMLGESVSGKLGEITNPESLIKKLSNWLNGENKSSNENEKQNKENSQPPEKNQGTPEYLAKVMPKTAMAVKVFGKSLKKWPPDLAASKESFSRVFESAKEEGGWAVVEVTKDGLINLAILGKDTVVFTFFTTPKLINAFGDWLMDSKNPWWQRGGMLVKVDAAIAGIGASVGVTKSIFELTYKNRTMNPLRIAGRLAKGAVEGATYGQYKLIKNGFGLKANMPEIMKTYQGIYKLKALEAKELLWDTPKRLIENPAARTGKPARLLEKIKFYKLKARINEEIAVDMSSWAPDEEWRGFREMREAAEKKVKDLTETRLKVIRTLRAPDFKKAIKIKDAPTRRKEIARLLKDRATEITKEKGVSNSAAMKESVEEFLEIGKKVGASKKLMQNTLRYLGPALVTGFGILGAADAITEDNEEVADLKWKQTGVNTGLGAAEIATVAATGMGAASSAALSAASTPYLFMINGGLDSAQEAKRKPLDWIQETNRDPEKLFHSIITTPNEITVGDSYRSVMPGVTVESVLKEKKETRRKIWEAILDLGLTEPKEKSIRLKYIENTLGDFYADNAALAKKVFRDSAIYFENYQIHEGNENLAKISTQSEIQKLEKEIQNREIKMDKSPIAYALFEAAKILGYEQNGTIEELKVFFNETDRGEKGIYWNGKGWALHEEGLEFDDDMGNDEETVTKIIERLKENAGNIFDSRNKSVVDYLIVANRGKSQTTQTLEKTAINMANAMQQGIQKFQKLKPIAPQSAPR
ncbi:MAG: hypothetical protein WCV72_00600 [Patescibacteria group bacterium]